MICSFLSERGVKSSSGGRRPTANTPALPLTSPNVLMTSAFSSALSHGLMIFGFAVSAAARFLTTMMNRVHGGPGATLGLFFRHAAVFVTFLDVLCLTFLFVRVF